MRPVPAHPARTAALGHNPVRLSGAAPLVTDLSLEDLERDARHAVGEMAYAYYSGGADDERLLLGKVLDRQDNPVADAVVYVSDVRTHAVKTYIVGPQGTYRFPGLAMTDYEVYADYKGHKSDTKSVSQFDDRPQVYIDLKIQGH